MLMPLSSYPFLYELESSQQMLSNRDDSGIFALFLTNSISVPFSNMPIIFLFSFHYFFLSIFPVLLIVCFCQALPLNFIKRLVISVFFKGLFYFIWKLRHWQQTIWWRKGEHLNPFFNFLLFFKLIFFGI